MRAVRTVVGVVGELLITAGLVIMLYVVWTLYWVGTIEGGKQADVVAAMEQQFALTAPAGGATGGPTPTGAPSVMAVPPIGQVYAILRIPRLGSGWAKPVYEGVGLDVLAKGLGHYPASDQPGEVGNVAIAGHRAGHGNPLIDIDAIRDGDRLIIETREGWFVYRVQRHKIVPPADWAVVDEAGPRAVALGERLGDRYEQAIVETLLGHGEFYRGNLARSVRRYHALAETARAAGNRQHEAWGLYAEARALLALGRGDDAIELTRRARVLLEGQTDVASDVICAGLLASAHAERGEWELAETEAASVRAKTRGLPVVFSTLHGYAGAAETYVALWGRARAANAARAEELGAAARGALRALEVFALAFAIGRPLALLVRGESARIAGDARKARRAWIEASEAASDLAMPYEAARAHAALAGIAVPGSSDRRRHLTAARRGFEALGCSSRAAALTED